MDVVIGTIIGAVVGFSIARASLTLYERANRIEFRPKGYKLADSTTVAKATKYGRKS